MTPIDKHAAPIARQTQQAVTGIVVGTDVLTLDGELPVEFLAPGDRIITRDSGSVTLRDVKVHIVTAPAVRIAAGSLGHDRPDEDLIMPAGQKVLIRDWRAQAMFCASEVMVDIARLADGQYVRGIGEVEMTLVELVFDKPHVIYAGGMELAAGTQVKEAA